MGDGVGSFAPYALNPSRSNCTVENPQAVSRKLNHVRLPIREASLDDLCVLHWASDADCYLTKRCAEATPCWTRKPRLSDAPRGIKTLTHRLRK